MLLYFLTNLGLPLQTILKIPGFTDSVFTHLLAGLVAGFFAVCIGSPVDVVGSAYKSIFCVLIIYLLLPQSTPRKCAYYIIL